MIIEILRYSVSLFTILTASIGFGFYNKLGKSIWRTFPIYLLILGIFDGIGYLIKDSFINNFLYIYILIPCQILYFSYLYYTLSNLEISKRIIKICTIFLVVSFIVFGYYFKYDFDNLDFYFTNNSNILFIIIVILYFYEVIHLDKILYTLKDMQFWVSLGLILYYLFTFPYYSFYRILFENNSSIIKIMFNIEKPLCLLMYTFFIIGFILKEKNESKYTI